MAGEGEGEVKVFRLEEVKEHNVGKGAKRSVWTVIHDKVYDVTKFLDEVRLWGEIIKPENRDKTEVEAKFIIIL